MCLIVFAYDHHPEYNLIFAANRDEFYQRPTQPAHFWDTDPEILAGKDLSAGGTWLGINRKGQFAALTNYRDLSIVRQDPPSRGEIVVEYLTQEKDSKSYLKELQDRAHRYMGFNVLAGEPGRLYHYSNKQPHISPVGAGIHGLSNHLLDTPWPKVKRAKSRLKTLIQSRSLSEEALFEILRDDRPADKDGLPDTGIPEELEKQVSPIFIQTDNYGTRSSTVLLINKRGQVTFEERRYEEGSTAVSETNRFTFSIEHPEKT